MKGGWIPNRGASVSEDSPGRIWYETPYSELCLDGASEPASGVGVKNKRRFVTLICKKEADATGIEELEEYRLWWMLRCPIKQDEGRRSEKDGRVGKGLRERIPRAGDLKPRPSSLRADFATRTQSNAAVIGRWGTGKPKSEIKFPGDPRIPTRWLPPKRCRAWSIEWNASQPGCSVFLCLSLTLSLIWLSVRDLERELLAERQAAARTINGFLLEFVALPQYLQTEDRSRRKRGDVTYSTVETVSNDGSGLVDKRTDSGSRCRACGAGPSFVCLFVAQTDDEPVRENKRD